MPGCGVGGGSAVMSMHKLTAGDGYAYLTRHVAAGDAGLDAGASLTAYYEQTGNPPGRWFGEGLAGLGDPSMRLRPGDVVIERAMTAVFRDGVDPLTDDALGRPYPRFDDGKRHGVVGQRPQDRDRLRSGERQVVADDAVALPVIEPRVRAAQRVIGQRIHAVAEHGRHRILGDDITGTQTSAGVAEASEAFAEPAPGRIAGLLV